MPKITIKNIEHREMISKNNKPYTSCRITAISKEGKDTVLSGFADNGGITKTWGAGDTVEVTLTQTESGYWNFDLTPDSKPSPDKVVALLTEIRDILLRTAPVKEIQKIAEDFGGTVEGDPNYVNPADINF